MAPSSFRALAAIKFSWQKEDEGTIHGCVSILPLASLSPSRRFLTVVVPVTAGEFAGQSEDTHLQAAAVVHGGLQSYPRDKDPVVSVDAVALAYVEAEGLSRSFDYLDEVDGVLRILKRRSPANFLNSCRRNISQRSRARLG